MSSRTVLVETAFRALADGDWQGAREGFDAALAVAATADALDGMARARWWLGEVPAAIESAEQAYAAYHRRGDMARAAQCALWLALRHYSNMGNIAAAGGWLARARTLVDTHQLAEPAGWVQLYECEIVGPTIGEARAWQARELAREQRDSDLELCATSEIGAKLVEQSRVVEGMRFLDEAMAGALAGEGSDPLTVVYASCNTVRSCVSSAAFERAMEWVRAADRFTQRFGCPFMFARCRAHYGTVLTAVGDWVQAEEELQVALRLSRDAMPAVHVHALAALADLRLLQGRVEEAERLVAGLHDDHAAMAVVAKISLARGRPSSAEALLRRRLGDLQEDALDGFLLRELLGCAELAQGHAEAAVKRARALADAGERLQSDIAVARGQRLLGQALAATDAADRAADHLNRALTTFARLRLPIEVAHTRLQLGRLLASSHAALAAEEAQHALDVLDAMGAGEADAAAALLRELGVRPARGGSRGLATLSGREREVFGLLGEALSNVEIAERLYISHRTAEHHVARIIGKLGLRTRGEAVAEAARHGATAAEPSAG